MKLQIKEFAELTGVSVRTLHYYDEIGLLKLLFGEVMPEDKITERKMISLKNNQLNLF